MKPRVAPVAEKTTRLARCELSWCGIGASGRVSCWGNDRHFGTLGVGTTTSTVPVAVGAPEASSIACGSSFACSLSDDGAHCWGSDADLRGAAATAPPRLVPLERPARRIVARRAEACVLDALGGVSCWGSDAASHPEPVRGLPKIRALDANERNTWACDEHGDVWVWGEPFWGDDWWKLARKGNEPVHAPKALHGCRDIAGGSRAVCIVDDAGKVSCFGFAHRGLPSTGHYEAPDSAPFVPALGHPARAVVMGELVMCALGVQGEVTCWGFGASSESRAVLRNMTTLRGASDIAVGAERVCGRFDNGRVLCEGAGEEGTVPSELVKMPDEARLP